MGSITLCLARAGKLDDALKYFKESVRISSSFAEGYNNIGMVYMQKGLYRESIKYFKKALEIKPDFPDARYNLLLALDKMKKSSKNTFK